MLVEPNYANFCGTDNGLTKDKICSRIANMINKKGVLVSRNANGVKKKIQGIEGQFCKAFDWANATGAGLKDSNPESFQEYTTKLCPYFDVLYPIFASRAKAKPLVSTDGDDLDLSTAFNNNIQSEGDSTSNESSEEDCNTDNDSDAVTTTIAISKKKTSDASSVSTSSPKKIKRKSMEDDGLAKYAEVARSMQQDQLLELKRHNRAIENIEQEKIKLLQGKDKWQDKIEEQKYKMKMYEDYQEVKKTMSKEKIRKLFPDMVQFIDSDDESD